MKVFLLPFGKINLLESNIAEIIINDGVVLDETMIIKYRKLLQSHLETPFSLLINKEHGYSYTFGAQLAMGKLDDVIAFLQNKKPTLARQLATDNFLPQASRFNQLDDMDWAFGNMGLQDKAKHFSTLFLEDLSDFIVECIDPHFGFSRYAERLGQSANSFDELHNELHEDITFIDNLTLTLLEIKLKEQQPKLVCFSVPFPGNLYSAFRCAQYIKLHYPNIKIALGGGFPNTELREINDKRVFSFFDFITLDDGELPIELIYNHVSSPINNTEFKRTFLLENDTVVYNNNSTKSDYKQSQVGTPDYSDLKLQQYISVIEIANPMHSLWSDGRWNKLTMAHGCYWGCLLYTSPSPRDS